MTRRSPAKSGASADLLAGGVNGKPTPPGTFHTVVHAELVVARSGRARYLLVYRCLCGYKHQATARAVADTAKRTTACGLPVILHAAVGEFAA